MDTRVLLERLYANRFDAEASRAKLELWKTLIDAFLQQYVKRDGAVLDIAGGSCEFINNIAAREKHLIDLNPRAKQVAASDVRVHDIDVFADAERWMLWQHFDHVFVSNFFEHLENSHQLLTVLDFIARVLKPGGTLIVIQPNFKYAYREYYDFVDHVLPVTDGSLSEALLATGFEIERMTPRFLPFTTKGRPASPAMLRIYLALPFAWRFFGGQLFAVARRV